MKEILNKIMDFIRNNSIRIKKLLKIAILIVIIGAGVIVGGIYAYARSNINYSEKELEKIAIEKLPGQVVKIKKELELEDASFEYTFFIKDKDNMLQEITLSPVSGAITDMDINDLSDHDRYDD